MKLNTTLQALTLDIVGDAVAIESTKGVGESVVASASISNGVGEEDNAGAVDITSEVGPFHIAIQFVRH